MAKIHRVSMYIVDPQGRFNNNEMNSIFSRLFGNVLAGAWEQQMNVETSEPFDWKHGCEEDKANCDMGVLAKHFVPNCFAGDASMVKPGAYYRHFKGKIVHVIGVARHTETSELMVFYACDNGTGIWCRPLSMFLSEVDHQKYPDVEQKMRFELIDDKDGE